MQSTEQAYLCMKIKARNPRLGVGNMNNHDKEGGKSVPKEARLSYVKSFPF
jgi:hypothetical protein